MVAARKSKGQAPVAIEPVEVKGRELLTQAIGLMNDALDLIYDQPLPIYKRLTLDNDDILRARGLLLRTMATPKQRDADFRAALTSLREPNENGYRTPLYEAFQRLTVELAWADVLQQEPLGWRFVPKGQDIDDIGKAPKEVP